MKRCEPEQNKMTESNAQCHWPQHINTSNLMQLLQTKAGLLLFLHSSCKYIPYSLKSLLKYLKCCSIILNTLIIHFND